MPTQNAKDSILGDPLIVARPIISILWKMYDFLPEGPYDNMAKEHQAVIDAGIYLNVHRLPQAISILQELISNETTKIWAEKIIAEIREIESAPGTSITEYEKALHVERSRTWDIEKFKHKKFTENKVQLFDLIGLYKKRDPRLFSMLTILAVICYIAAQIL